MKELVKKLHEVEERYIALSEELLTPEVALDHKKYSELAKTRSALEDVVTLFRKYQEDITNMADAKLLLQEETDPDMVAMYKEEIEAIEENIPEYRQQFRLMLLPKDPCDGHDTIMEIRGGTGGEEAALFAQDLYRMYCRYAELKGWKIDVMDTSYTGLGGFKQITFAVKGEDVYSRLKYESGVHRVQRVPSTESSGRIHTSAATVVVMPEADEVEVNINPDEVRVDLYCASGPGGQHVNTTQSAVRLTHEPTGIVVQCQDEKSQMKNKAKAMKVLRSRILQVKREEQEAEISGNRRSQVGSGDRSEKFRTYNFPQNRVTTHTIHFTVHNLDGVLNGEIDEIINQMIALDQAEKLRTLE